MRITRMHDLHSKPGYYSPAVQARQKHRELRDTRWAITRAQAYREAIEELFAPYAWPGGYPLFAMTDNGDDLCMECAKRYFLTERASVTIDVNWEGDTIQCDECNAEIESAYGPVEE